MIVHTPLLFLQASKPSAHLLSYLKITMYFNSCRSRILIDPLDIRQSCPVLELIRIVGYC